MPLARTDAFGRYWIIHWHAYDGLERDSMPRDDPSPSDVGKTCSPRILVVLVLPADENEWVHHSVESLILRRCAYWESLRGRDPIDGLQENTTIHIPTINLFSPSTLQTLMEKVSREEAL